MKRALRAVPATRVAPRRSGPRISPQRMMREAEDARRQSYSPYSHFAVGAALLTRDGRIITGTNIENASYGLAVCAERVALWKAVSEGTREFVAIAIAAEPGSAASPCGACRQVLHEFAPGLWVTWRDTNGRIVGRKLDELLASPFTPAELAAANGKPRTKRGRRG